MKKIALKNAARGTAFDYAGQSWILLENDPTGRTLCLSKDITETRAFDEGNCNNFAVASSNKYLNGPYLDNLVDACNGSNAFLESELDLTTDDGLKDYGTCTVTIFLLTVDQYTRPSSPSSKRAPASRSTRATSAGSSARLSCPCSLPSTTASTTSAGRRSSAMRGARCWTPSASGRT